MIGVTMKKLLTILLTLFLFSSAYADEQKTTYYPTGEVEEVDNLLMAIFQRQRTTTRLARFKGLENLLMVSLQKELSIIKLVRLSRFKNMLMVSVQK